MILLLFRKCVHTHTCAHTQNKHTHAEHTKLGRTYTNMLIVANLRISILRHFHFFFCFLVSKFLIDCNIT